MKCMLPHYLHQNIPAVSICSEMPHHTPASRIIAEMLQFAQTNVAEIRIKNKKW